MPLLLFSFSIFAAQQSVAKSQTKNDSVNLGAYIYKSVSNSVFLVKAYSSNSKMQGSGVAYLHGFDKSKKTNLTWIVTNAHVVSDANSITVEKSGKIYPAILMYADADIDIAILTVADGELEIIKSYGSNDGWIGDKVFAIGSPLGLENSITEGIISGRREYKGVKFIQTSAAISKGNSGGGLFDSKGQLIGITTFKLLSGENINFAVDSGLLAILDEAYLAASLVWVWDNNENPPFALVKWMLNTKLTNGEFAFSYFNREFLKNIKNKDPERMYALNGALVEELMSMFRSQKNSNARVASNTTEVETTQLLVCPVYMTSTNELINDLNVKIDKTKSTVNGKPADFSEGAIEFAYGDKGIVASLNRYTGAITFKAKDLRVIATAKCTSINERKF